MATKTKAKRKTTKAKESAANRHAQKQMGAVILFASGILVAAVTYIKGQNLWLFFHNLLFGLFGWTTYLLAPLLIYIAVISAMDKPMSAIHTKLWQTISLLILIAGTVHIFSVRLPEDEGFADTISYLYQSGVNLKGGGLAGAVVGMPLMALFGKSGASIIIVLLTFVFIMLLTGSTLIGLYQSASKPVKKLEEVYTAKVEEREERERQKPSFPIDVPMDEEKPMPEHPVKSEKKRPEPPAEKPAQSSKDKLLSMFDETPPVPVPSVQAPEAEGPAIFGEDELPGSSFAPPALEGELENRNPEIEDIVSRFIFQSEDEAKEYGGESPRLMVEEDDYTYMYPPISLLREPPAISTEDISEELKNNAQTLVDTLKSFGVQTRVLDISRGPAVTRYELQPSAGVKISKITNLSDDIALNLSASGIRIEAPIPNKPAVGIEIPNKVISAVSIREVIDSHEFVDAESRLSVALGKDITGHNTVANLATMPHILIAGATGSGKSVCINSIIISMLYKSSPDEVKLLMVDPKVVELGVYNGIPHLLVPVVTDPKKAAGALNWAVAEMLKRYKTFADNSVRDLSGYNKLAAEKDGLEYMPQIVIIIDELADLMMAAPNEVEDSICRLAQMARAAGMHLVIATQRPSVDVITGIIKANIPSRIAFSVSSQVDSRTILDMGGAEKLLGRGDMLYYPVGAAKPKRVQGCFVTDAEVEKVVAFVKSGGAADYDQKIVEDIESHAIAEKGSSKDSGGGFADHDEMLDDAIEAVVEAGQASTSLLQRRLKLGYARAARIIDQLEERGIVGPFEGSKPRQVLISRERWLEMRLSQSDNSPSDNGLDDIF